MVRALDFRSEGRWFDAQFLPSRCFLRQDTLPHIVSLHPPGCINGCRRHTIGGGGVTHSQLLHATETGIISGRVGLLSPSATLSFYPTELSWRCRSLVFMWFSSESTSRATFRMP